MGGGKKSWGECVWRGRTDGCHTLDTKWHQHTKEVALPVRAGRQKQNPDHFLGKFDFRSDVFGQITKDNGGNDVKYLIFISNE